MSKTIVIARTIKQLLPYINDKGILEIAVRGENQKFAEFVKVALGKAVQKDGSGKILKFAGNAFGNTANPLSGAINLVADGANMAIGLKNMQLANKTIKMVEHLTKLANLNLVMSGANLVLGGANLFATCAGFAIVNKKLETVSAQIADIVNTYKEDKRLSFDYKINKLISKHSNMLDCREKQNPYDENQMWQLVSDEYNYLKLLIDIFNSDNASKPPELIFTILSLAGMLSASLCYFNEIYYLNNSKTRSRHNDYEKWLSIFDTLLEESFVEKIQDHGYFDMDLYTTEVDCYYKSYINQISEAKQAVVDNQYIIELLQTSELIQAFRDLIDESAKETIRDACAAENVDDEETLNVLNEAINQLGIA